MQHQRHSGDDADTDAASRQGTVGDSPEATARAERRDQDEDIEGGEPRSGQPDTPAGPGFEADFITSP